MFIEFSRLIGSGTACCYADQYSDGNDCQPCLDGADCSFIGSTLASLKMQPGYWRASNSTTDVRECWLIEACVGTNNRSTQTTRRTTDTANIGQTDDNLLNDDSSIYCANGYKGPCKYTELYTITSCLVCN
jgi:hypothetical protein